MSSTLKSQPRRTDTRPRSRNNDPSTGGNKKSQKAGKGEQNESLQLLCELFPHWAEEDLAAVLSEVNGDLETACNRIADGHANQWTAAGKKVPKPVEKKAAGKKSKDTWTPPAESVGASSAAPAGSRAAPASWDTPTTASTELTWDLKAEKNVTSLTEEIRTVTEELRTVSIKDENGASESHVTVKETTVVASVVQQVLQESDESSQTIIVEQQTVEVVEEEDFVVRLPSMPARKQAALEIEPSAVLLPFTVPIKTGTNISFGAPGLSSKVVFGESKAASTAATAASPVSSGPAASATQKVYSPEELFASATRSSGQAYATTSVDAVNPAGSPPGLSAPKSPYLGQSYEHQSMEQHGSSSLNHTPQRRHQQQQQQMPFYGQRYDSYGSPSQQQQQHSFAQRYNPYAGAQDESFGAVPPSSYYSGARQSQSGASAGYYPHPHHYAPHVMYGADPYGAAAFTAPPTTRYHPGASSSAGSNYASGTAGQQQYHQSPGSNSSRSRMF